MESESKDRDFRDIGDKGLEFKEVEIDKGLESKDMIFGGEECILVSMLDQSIGEGRILDGSEGEMDGFLRVSIGEKVNFGDDIAKGIGEVIEGPFMGIEGGFELEWFRERGIDEESELECEVRELEFGEEGNGVVEFGMEGMEGEGELRIELLFGGVGYFERQGVGFEFGYIFLDRIIGIKGYWVDIFREWGVFERFIFGDEVWRQEDDGLIGIEEELLVWVGDKDFEIAF